MQFVPNGPDIPEALLQAHEDGRMVFFCGAGISYPAGLPDFKGLVDQIYRLVGTIRDDIEQEAYKRNRFDATLDLLERRLPGQRMVVRKALAKALEPELRRKGAKDTHTALLELARSREGALRLVTTNFDRIFARLTVHKKPVVPDYPAPLLPIPKNSWWNGLVYLHGLLPEQPDEFALNQLVLTSGDFGRAYLTERWAARFVSELFRNYVVCFVGYSIDDPVLRYMMDALAADRMLGEVTPQAYAFGDFAPGQELRKNKEWKAKGVVPILYDHSNEHLALHRTLKVWAETYRDGILGKERIVVDLAMARPSASTQQDDFVGRMLWALSDKSGLPAKRFADFDPAPPLEWLTAFSEHRFLHGDLVRFGVPPLDEVDKNLSFSLVGRPAPYTNAPWMMPVSGGGGDSQWDNMMYHLARWLVRHLDDPNLILWLAQRGGQLNDRLTHLIEERLNTFARLEQAGKSDELARIRAQAANAIPRPELQVLWRLLLTGRAKSFRREPDLYRWKDRLRRNGLTTTLRLELREALAPNIALKKPSLWKMAGAEADSLEGMSQPVDWDLVLAADDVQFFLRDMEGVEQWHGALPVLLEDFQQTLRDALDLMNELGEADERSDRSHWNLPSIGPHRQNLDASDWVSLIELVRDSWLAVREIDSTRAGRIAQEWFTVPYPTFKRLALFAASHGCIAPDQWVEWLLADDAWWLWAFDTKRESLRLLVLQGIHLTTKARDRLETSILRGPLRAKYQHIEQDRWKGFVDHSVWLRLAKLKSSDANLGHAAAEALEALSAANHEWRLEDDQRDEFSSWASDIGDTEFEERYGGDSGPRKRGEVVPWLKRTPVSQRPFYEDKWRKTCRKHPLNWGYALYDLAKDGLWPQEPWREVFQAWSRERRLLRSWRLLASWLQTMPDEALTEIEPGMAWWVEAVSKSMDRRDGLFLDLCRRILALPHSDNVKSDRPFSRSTDHPIGQVTRALLNLWLKREPNDNDTLPADLVPFFIQLCDLRVRSFRHGRVQLASHLITLFRVDRPWTEAYLLPNFAWKIDAAEARAAWDGFLWSPRLYTPLLIAFREQFLETARHYSELGLHAKLFAVLLTHAALDLTETYTVQDFRAAFSSLPPEGLKESALALVHALEGAGEQRESYWTNRIQKFWHNVWPKERDRVSEDVGEKLAWLSIAARGQFHAVLDCVKDYLLPIERPHFIIDRLRSFSLPKQSPEDALELLSKVIGKPPMSPHELRYCLKEISEAKPTLVQDSRYRRLDEYCRRRNF